MAYNLKYTGKELEEKLDTIDSIPKLIATMLVGKDFVTNENLKCILKDYAPSDYSTLPIDGITIYWDKGVLKSLGSGGECLWELRTNSLGELYIYSKLPVVTQFGITMYADGGMLDLPSIYAGLPIDNDTIYWAEIKDDQGNVIDKRLKARVGSGEGGITPTLLGDLINVGSWANELAKDDRVLFQQNGTASWVGLSTEDLVKKYAYSKTEADGFLEKKWTRNDTLIGNWNAAYGWGNHANARYLKENDISNRYLKLSGGTMNDNSSIISGFIYPLVDDKYALGLPNRAYGYVYSHRYFVDNLEIKKSQNDVIFIDANLVVRGGITMYGTDGTTAPSIWEGAPKATTSDTPEGKGIASFDSKSFSVTNGHVSFIGNVGGLDESALASYLSTNKYLTQLSGDTMYLSIKGNAETATTATNANKVLLTGSANNGNYRLVFSDVSAGISGNNSLYVDSMNEGARYNPSTNQLTCLTYMSGVSGYYIYNTDYRVYANNNEFILNTPAYFSLRMSGSTKLYMTSSGLFGIGTTSPESKLHVAGSVQADNKLWLTNNDDGTGSYGLFQNGVMLLRKNSAGDTVLSAENGSIYFRPKGSVHGDVQCYITTSGNLLTTGGITMYSDLRKKTILSHVELSLKEVADAPLIEHYYNSDEKKTTHVGSVAQYWAGLNDWFCKEDGEGFLTMEIQNAALASAISVARELTRYESKTDKQIKRLKKRIRELEDEIETLKSK